MHEPWTVKKYIDEVFIAGHGKLYQNDGRHRVSPTEGFGTGGLLHGKKHMLSVTWNAPIEAFTRESDFFEGKGVDDLYMHFHKLNEFLGMSRLPTSTSRTILSRLSSTLEKSVRLMIKHQLEAVDFCPQR